MLGGSGRGCLEGGSTARLNRTESIGEARVCRCPRGRLMRRWSQQRWPPAGMAEGWSQRSSSHGLGLGGCRQTEGNSAESFGLVDTTCGRS